MAPRRRGDRRTHDLRTLAREIDPTIPEERIQEATRVRIQRFKDSLTRIPAENVETLRDLRAAGFRLDRSTG